MATKAQWVMPEEVRDYTEIADVQARADEKLSIDIARAMQYVISYTHSKFEDAVPEAVKTAVLLLAERYAQNAVNSKNRLMKSETHDDYSYTTADNAGNVDDLGLSALLEGFVVARPRNSVNMSLRKL